MLSVYGIDSARAYGTATKALGRTKTRRIMVTGPDGKDIPQDINGAVGKSISNYTLNNAKSSMTCAMDTS